jgi:nucleoid-associated protein YgaU
MAMNRPDPSRTEQTPGQHRAKTPTDKNMPPPGGLASGAPAFSSAETGASSSATKIYDVQPGDTLEKIAMNEYGSADDWPVIFEANRDLLEDPEQLASGIKLRLPTK